MLSNLQLIKNYGMDIDDCENEDLLSPFDLIATLAVRDSLEEDYNNLSDEEKRLLKENDKKLIKNAVKFNQELKKVLKLDGSIPVERWWTHLDEVISGELFVDLDNHQVHFKNNDMAATLTA